MQIKFDYKSKKKKKQQNRTKRKCNQQVLFWVLVLWGEGWVLAPLVSWAHLMSENFSV